MTTTLDTLASTITLNNGLEMPMLGFGTNCLKEGAEAVAAVRDALEVGYRLIDTAKLYDNEVSVGRAIKDFGDREQVFLTTKLWHDDHGNVAGALDASLQRLDTDDVDLYLIHWPCGMGFMDTWRAMEKALADGKAKAIGVSNFQEPHLRTLLDEADVTPAVNQVEFHPWLTQPTLHEFHRDQGIVPQAWSPLMSGRFGEIKELTDIGETHGKAAPQVLVRWCLQHGVATIPRSAKRRHIESNADVFDFTLSDDEMTRIDALDQHRRLGPDPFEFPVAS